MRFAKDDSDNDLDIGSKPIIFVVHSMGGLVVKKAYLLGIHDVNYKAIIESISAVIFLSTPHRGTNLAEVLNRIVSATFQSSKSFISDLNKSSFAIEELNEQFRHLAPSLSIWSFYETLTTSIGPRKIMVLEKDSSILGYPTEISKPLHADHQGMCKYNSPSDMNYVSVKNAIKSLVTQFMRKAESESGATEVEIKATLTDLFRGYVISEDEYNTLRQRRVPGTCHWILEDRNFLSWFSPSHESRVLWYSALPASGKSILSTYVIDHCKSSTTGCQFFHFKYSDPGKRSVANCFRSLAFQLAKDVPKFGKLLCDASRESLGLETNDITMIWRNTFHSILAQSSIEGPLYWIIDALDECDGPKTLLGCLKGLSTISLPIRILILSRNTDVLSVAFDRLSHVVPVTIVEKSNGSHNLEDIKVLVRQELEHIHCSSEFRQQLSQNIIRRSEGNFLWTKLVLDELMYCHTEESIQEVLNEVPDDMNLMYERMEKSLIDSTRRSNAPLIKALLEWTICAQRALKLNEISQALKPEFTGFLDLKRTIKEACGQFIQIDEGGNVSILHHTTSEYFSRNNGSQFSINPLATHAKLFLKTISALEEPTLRWSLSESRHALQLSQPFVFYSAISWSYHLGHCQSVSSENLDRLMSFFRSPAVLSWIYILSLLRRLDVLTKASRVLALFVRNTRKRDAQKNPMLHRLSDLELLEEWIVDLAKIVGKFGRNLVSEPEVIYNVIPAVSPGKTAISRLFRDTQPTIQVQGNENGQWNDNLGRFALSSDSRAWRIACAVKHLAVLELNGRVRIWDPSSFMENRCISHPEPVTAMAFNANGTKLVTYGLRTTRIWSVASGRELLAFNNPPLTKAMKISFIEKDTKLLFGGDDNTIRYAICDVSNPEWQIVHPNVLLKETHDGGGTFVNSPMCLAFSDNKDYVGVSYRGAPLSVWRISDGKCIGRCKRSKDVQHTDRRPSTNWFAVDRFTWNPVSGHILGIYKDGCIFKWQPFTGENFEVRKPADEITASPNGKLFATSSSDGSIRVWNFAFFTIIYQLSAEDLVTTLVFSPDSRRFYDLRGGIVNAWEPDVVARFNENDGHTSDTNSEEQSSTTISRISEERIPYVDCITAIAPSPDRAGYCAGFENGTVLLFEDQNIKPSEVANFGYFLDIIHIVWSENSVFIAIATLAGDVLIKSIHRDQGEVRFSSLPKPEAHSNESKAQFRGDSFSIQGLIFSLDSEFLFVWTERECFVCAVRTGSLQAYLETEAGYEKKWFRHPTNHDTLLAFSTQSTEAYSWKTLAKLWSCDFVKRSLDNRLNKQDLTSKLKATKLGPSDQSKSLLRVIVPPVSEYSMLTFGDNTHSREIGIFKTAEISDLVRSKVELTYVPVHIATRVLAPLGILKNQRLIFLDHELWLCSYCLGANDSASETYERFYFIPRDWADAGSLEKCVLDSEGMLLWPREGQVLRIACDFDYATAFRSL
ncbi:unnamed protein product [Clonostachys chloroleuca]|uniref:Vegetative incompatibility protein HET-E-1 n=1 Tax=Clonostachys chloroleuca TaxID=1926264 RepID=A0AA35LRN6_9HYPO|nr:unnamed protein product [Clonostachys chloroleuca]